MTYSIAGPASVSGSKLTITGAGIVTVTANQTGNATYAAATPVSHSFTVTPATLAVTGANATRAFGAANPTFTYTMTGFVNGDVQATATSGSPSLTTTATATSAAGTYPITVAVGTLTSANYSFAFVNGTPYRHGRFEHHHLPGLAARKRDVRLEHKSHCDSQFGVAGHLHRHWQCNGDRLGVDDHRSRARSP